MKTKSSKDSGTKRWSPTEPYNWANDTDLSLPPVGNSRINGGDCKGIPSQIPLIIYFRFRNYTNCPVRRLFLVKLQGFPFILGGSSYLVSSQQPGVVGPLPDGRFMAFKWGLLTTY